MEILKSGKIIYMITKQDGKIIYINNHGCYTLGFDDLHDLSGRNIQEFYIHPVDRNFYLERLEKHGFIKDFEIRFSGRDGTIKTYLENAIKLVNPSNGNTEIESVIIDISGFVDTNIETIKLNLQLADINKKLKDAYNTMAQQEKMASVGELAAGVAHEINNPLGFVISNSKSLERYIGIIKKIYTKIKNIKSYEDLLNENDFDYILSDMEDILKENDEGLKRIAKITDSLKRFSRMDSEKMTDNYDLNQAVLDTLTIAKSHYKYSAEILMELGDIPAFSCYGDAINQVILNLLVNSSQALNSKYEKKEGVIKITTIVENNYAVFRISDNGPGIPEEIVHKIFDPFFTTKEIGRGTGLGLSLCYDIIVHKHFGNIWYERNNEGGADFIFKIPLVIKNE